MIDVKNDGDPSPRKTKYWSFEQAREFVHTLGIKNKREWKGYCKSGKKPAIIPAEPDFVYKQEWQNYGDWLGTGLIATRDRVYLPFEEARNYVRALSLKSLREWDDYCTSGQKPISIPSHASRYYAREWKGWGDWLGTGRTSNQHREFWPFEQARDYVRALGLKSEREWKEYSKSGERPAYIPSSPFATYRQEWKGYCDWLGMDDTSLSIDGTLMKRCPSCTEGQQWHPATLEYFQTRKDSEDGMRGICKECRLKANIDYKQSRREELSVRQREYYQSYRKEYLRTHPDIARSSAHNRRAHKLHNGGKHTEADIRQQYENQKGKCYYCKAKVGKKYHVDHVIPLSKGGSNTPENLVIACPACNVRKSNKIITLF